MTTAKWWELVRGLCAAGLIAVAAPGAAWAQQRDGGAAEATTAEVLRELKQQVAELQSTIRDLRDETSRYHQETQELRAELKAALAQPRALAATLQAEAAPGRSDAAAATTVEHGIAKLQEQYDLLSGKVDDQYQTKVESASKYRVRLSGIVLLNLFENRGSVDSPDVPAIADPPVNGTNGSFGGTLRQSQIGLEVFGPTWHGARLKSNLQVDFGGGFPATANGVTMGVVRLRTAVARLDWPTTSVVGGQDAPFFSPLSPTSLATLTQPALAYSGNLWNWIPQLRVEHRVGVAGGSNFTVQAGILDPLTGETPDDPFYPVAQAGQTSRQPAYATRVAWTSADESRPTSIGVASYYSRQNWGYGRMVDGWAVMADASVPISRWFSLTGEMYRGRAIGGLGGGLGDTAVYQGAWSTYKTKVKGLDAVGGWAQMKMRASPRLEFNVAAGQDNPFVGQLRRGAVAGNPYYPDTVRNRSLLTNAIYHPRSDLLLSLEYRRIESYKLVTPNRDADQINLVMGVLF
ncbi:MAG: hypothetical protein LAO06_03670 [Acidobacteriia bacterium]|nr:hypothetical protein [Terriglobia bacterium]